MNSLSSLYSSVCLHNALCNLSSRLPCPPKPSSCIISCRSPSSKRVGSDCFEKETKEKKKLERCKIRDSLCAVGASRSEQSEPSEPSHIVPLSSLKYAGPGQKNSLKHLPWKACVTPKLRAWSLNCIEPLFTLPRNPQKNEQFYPACSQPAVRTLENIC